MAADIKQDYFFFNQGKGERNTVAAGEGNGKAAIEPTLKGVKVQVRCKGVLLQIGNNTAEAGLEIGMSLKKFTGLPQKLFRSDNAVH